MRSSNYQAIEQILHERAGHFLGKYRDEVRHEVKNEHLGKHVWLWVVFLAIQKIFGSWDCTKRGRNVRATLPWGVKCWWVQNGADGSLASRPNPATQGCAEDTDISVRPGGAQRGKHYRGGRALCLVWRCIILGSYNRLWALFLFCCHFLRPQYSVLQSWTL